MGALAVVAYSPGPGGPFSDPPRNPWWRREVTLRVSAAAVSVRLPGLIMAGIRRVGAGLTRLLPLAAACALSWAALPSLIESVTGWLTPAPSGRLPTETPSTFSSWQVLYLVVVVVPPSALGLVAVAGTQKSWALARDWLAGLSPRASWLRGHTYRALRALQFALEAGASTDAALAAAVASAEHPRVRSLLAAALERARDDAPAGRALWETGLLPPACREALLGLRGQHLPAAEVEAAARALRPVAAVPSGWTRARDLALGAGVVAAGGAWVASLLHLH